MTRDEKLLAESIGYRITRRRTFLGISKRRLAKNVGACDSYTAHLEAGRRLPSLPMLYRIAGELGVSIFDLVPREAP
jgi:transcriptional regulator with XRE-family HTH domain